MKWITILFALCIGLIIVFADLGKLGFLGIVNSIPYGDKAGHFILYGILTLLLDLTIIHAHRDINPKLIALRTGLILALLIGIEEFSQQFIASRTFSVLDLIFSYLGLIFFSWVAVAINRER